MKHFQKKINANELKNNSLVILRMEQFDLQKYALIKKDVTDLRKIIIDENHIHDWDKLLILYTVFLIYQHVFASYTMMQHVLKYEEFNFKRDFRNIYMFFFFVCNLRVSYLYMIKTVSKVDKRLAGSLHTNMGEYFDY